MQGFTGFHKIPFQATLVLSFLTILAACEQGGSPTAPHELSLAAPIPIAIGGTYEWSERGTGVMPEDVAIFLYGIQPEGKATHFTCENSGTFTLVQAGASFTGTSTQIGTCVTKGGQVFDNSFPEPFPILNGRITGQSIHFDFSAPFCPYVGVLEAEGGMAFAMEGTGRCGPFGPRDVFKAVSWEATRVGG